MRIGVGGNGELKSLYLYNTIERLESIGSSEFIAICLSITPSGFPFEM